MRESRELKVKYFVEDLEELRCVPGSDWVDLRAAEDVTMKEIGRASCRERV